VIDPNRKPRALMLDLGRQVTDADVDALSKEIHRQKVGDSLSVRLDLIELSLDKRLRQPAPAKVSGASTAGQTSRSPQIHHGLPKRTRR